MSAMRRNGSFRLTARVKLLPLRRSFYANKRRNAIDNRPVSPHGGQDRAAFRVVTGMTDQKETRIRCLQADPQAADLAAQ